MWPLLMEVETLKRSQAENIVIALRRFTHRRMNLSTSSLPVQCADGLTCGTNVNKDYRIEENKNKMKSMRLQKIMKLTHRN